MGILRSVDLDLEALTPASLAGLYLDKAVTQRPNWTRRGAAAVLHSRQLARGLTLDRELTSLFPHREKQGEVGQINVMRSRTEPQDKCFGEGHGSGVVAEYISFYPSPTHQPDTELENDNWQAFHKTAPLTLRKLSLNAPLRPKVFTGRGRGRN